MQMASTQRTRVFNSRRRCLSAMKQFLVTVMMRPSHRISWFRVADPQTYERALYEADLSLLSVTRSSDSCSSEQRKDVLEEAVCGGACQSMRPHGVSPPVFLPVIQ